MSNYSYFTDPAQEWTLELDRDKGQADLAAFQRMSQDPAFVNNLAEYATTFPQGSAALGLALAQGGIPASDPMVQQYVNQEIATRQTIGPVDEAGDSWHISDPLGPVDDAIVTGIKGATRWGFAAWDAAYNLLAGGAPIRARELAQQEDMSYAEAWKQQDPYFFEALGGLVSGERVNLGSGFFPNSDVDEDVQARVNAGMSQIERDTAGLGANERMVTQLEAAPGVWRDSIQGSLEQQQLGTPLTQLNYADAESVMFTVDPWLRSSAGQQVKTPWSPGRIFAANLVEPGTEPYSKISGFGDFGSQLFLDPLEYVGIGWARHGLNGRRIWGLGKKTAEVTEEAVATAKYASEAEAAGRVLGAGQPRMNLPQPETMAAITGDMAPQVGLPGRTVMVGEEGAQIPWWRSSEGRQERVVNAYDPPDWYIDQARGQREGALEGWVGSSRRILNGVYDIDLPRLRGQAQKTAKVIRRETGKNKYWDVTMPDGSKLPNMPDDPRFSTPSNRFNTKAEAEAAVRNHVGAQGSPGFDDLSVHGMSEDEFLNSFDDLYVDDFARVANKGGKGGVVPERVMHRTGRQGPEVAPSRGNARVRVYGKTIDATSGSAADLPEGLKAALRRDRKLRGDNLVGFGDPQLEKFDETLKWMEDNGYGKLQWDEDTVLISDKFVGGNSKDPLGRMWFEDGGKPMSSIDLIDETLDSPTPNEIRDIIGEINDQAQAVGAVDEGLEEGVRASRYGVDPVTHGDSFREAIEQTARDHPNGAAVEVKDADFYVDADSSLYLSDDGLSGVAVTPDGDLVSVFKHPQSSANVDEVIAEAAQKAETLDAFTTNGFLPNKYAEHGFRPVAKFEFDRQYAPDGWDFARDGEPDIVVMVKDTADELGLPSGTWDEVVDSVPTVDVETAYDMQAAAKQQLATRRQAGGNIAGEGFVTDIPKPHPGAMDPRFAEEAIAPGSLTDRIKQVDMEDVPPPTIDGVRPDFDPEFQLKGKKADMFAARIAGVVEAGDAAKLDRLLRFATSAGVPVPNSVKRQLLEAKDTDEIKAIFGEWLVREGGQEMILPGGTQYGRLASMGMKSRGTGVSSSMGSGLQRRFATSLGGADVNMVEDPSSAYQLFDRAMPHYNVRRNSKIQAYDDAGAAIDGKMIDVEEIFTDLRNMDAGDKGAAYNIMGRFSEVMFSSLKADGVDTALAKRAARWWEDNAAMANFDAERFGRIDLGSSPYDMTVVKDELIGGLGVQLTADLWGGQLKPVDARTMKRVANETDLLGKITNRLAWTSELDEAGKLTITDRAYARFLDDTITKVWKPFVLLRAAWTLRILMDDQLRLAAEGYGMLNHPLRLFNYVVSSPDEWRHIFTGGTVDVFGTPMTLENVSEMMHGNKFRQAMMRKSDPAFGPGAYGTKMHVRQGKDNISAYTEGLTFEMERLRGSPMTKILAGEAIEDAVPKTVKWLKTDEGAAELRNQAALHEKMEGVAEKILAKDDTVLNDIVSRQYAILHHRTGGKVVLDNGNGQMLDFNNLSGYGKEGAETDGVAKWVIEREGDSDILSWVSGQDEVAGTVIGKIETEESAKAMQNFLRTKVSEAPSDHFPDAVRRPRPDTSGGVYDQQGQLSAKLDEATRKLFDFFMGMPSDALSRSPEFRRAYWRKIGELSPYMDENLRAAVLKNAPPDARADIARMAKTKRLGDVEGQLTDIDQVDQFAKSFGLTMVERTLFSLTSDLSGKRNIADSLRLVFPFGEAWGEFITRWGRLMVTGDRNIKNLNRLRQTVNGARRSGFFEENDYGQEVFTYPAFMNKAYAGAHDILNNLPMGEKFLGGDVGDYMEGIESTGNVESLNFASGVLPGFGPVFQIAARQLPQDPQYDWIKDIIAPFGTEGNLAFQFAPAWVKRVAAAHGGEDDPQLTYQFNSTVMDVMRTKIDQGEFQGVTSESDINALVKEAEEEAQGILMVRAAATFFNPASPQYKFQKEDADGLVWSYNNLGQAYYELEQTLGEEAAFDEFFNRFGFLPQAFTGSKSYKVVDRSIYEEGGRYERSQPELFEDYPSVAMYFDPNIGLSETYDHGQVLRQLEQGLRESYTGEQFAYLQQDQLGDIWWDRVQGIAAGFPATATGQRDAYLASQRELVQEQYPFWNKPVPGKRQAVTNEQQRDELLRAMDDSRVSSLPVFGAVRIYESLREQVLAQIREAGASSISGPKSLTTDSGRIATYGRNWLREKASELSIQYPEFEPLWRTVYYSEVSESHDAPEPVQWNLYGESDVFEEIYGVSE